MGIPSEMRDLFENSRKSFLNASSTEDAKLLRSKMCTQVIDTSEKKRSKGKKLGMGIPSEMRDLFANSRKPFLIASPAEDAKLLRSKMCTQEGVREGAKAAAIAAVVSAVPTLVAVRKIPWAKRNLNYTAQALIISAASIAAYFITADKTILECARKNSHYKPT